jgi:RimJ/RimL family protein N-acetyltransferase
LRQASVRPQGPERIETARLVVRRPYSSDAAAIFARYASDPAVTKYLGWPTHRSVDDKRWSVGPYLLESRDGALMGSTGLSLETPYRGSTGYVLAKDAWGRGYATEALQTMTILARSMGVRRLYAICHVDHEASWRVLEKCGFTREGILRKYAEFPNLAPGEPSDVCCYALVM